MYRKNLHTANDTGKTIPREENYFHPMTNDLNISKLVLNQFLCNDLHTVPKVQSLDYFLRIVLRTVCEVQSSEYDKTNQIFDGIIL